ncbi:hypothetical protein KDH_12450 [Dictyobacter sp. S3.2.2.5]|uniref:Uncharacterized protein n=1 Tax=Dictyobacter halimunensis TaxID=3026934 RepID=A0ABQ6FPP1_9CHLR|nr:hypothetical protein KDH_12450 [Dictyobacter sp. S3.2.2.5]
MTVMLHVNGSKTYSRYMLTIRRQIMTENHPHKETAREHVMTEGETTETFHRTDHDHPQLLRFPLKKTNHANRSQRG